MKKILLLLLAIALSPLLSTAQCTIDAGYNRSICGFSGVQVPLQATSTITTTVWTSSGTGTFVDATSLNTFYIPSAADISAGGIITLTITGSDGSCSSQSSSLSLLLLAIPTIDAGLDQIICNDTSPAYLNATATNAATVSWTSSGTGVFTPDAQTLNAIYTPSVADILLPSLTLSLYATSSTACVSPTDDVVLTFDSSPTVDAGPNLSTCGNTVQLNATHTGTQILWSTNGTGTFSDPTITNPTYAPSQADRLAGTVALTATTTSISCTAGHTITLTIDTRVRLIPGPAITVCPNASVLPTVEIDAGTVTWTSSGTGAFTDPTSLTPVYTPSAADYTAGQVTLTATSSTNGSCPSESGTVAVTLTAATSVANAGADFTTCKTLIDLNGTVTNATGGNWTTDGTGTFGPTSNFLNTLYTFSPADIIAGSITFTLNPTGACGTTVTDEVVITIASSSAPIVDAGTDQNITGPSATLSGSLSGASGVLWTSDGTGTFASPTSLSTTYTPSAQDIVNGLVKLTLTSTGNGSCEAASDHLYLSIGNTFTISGVIQTPTSTLDEGVVLIYKKENTTLKLIKTIDINTSDAGAYSADNIPAGNYIIFASPTRNSVLVNTYLPTYSGGVQNWDQAQVFSITTNTTKNLALSPYTSADPTWNTGTDIIAGTVFLDGSGQSLLRTTSTAAHVPAANAIVYLINANGDKIAYTLADLRGRYMISNVRAGTYRAIAELGGTAMTGSPGYIQIVTDGNFSTAEDGSIHVEERTSLTTGVMYAKTFNLNTYPNPATTKLSFDLVSSNTTGTVKLLNQAGVVQLQQQIDLSASTVTLDVEKIPSGIYILQITLADEVYTSKVIKY